MKWLGNKDDILDSLLPLRATDDTIVEYFADKAVYMADHGVGRRCVYNEITLMAEVAALPIIQLGELMKMDKFDGLCDVAKVFLGLEVA